MILSVIWIPAQHVSPEVGRALVWIWLAGMFVIIVERVARELVTSWRYHHRRMSRLHRRQEFRGHR